MPCDVIMVWLELVFLYALDSDFVAGVDDFLHAYV